MVFSHIYNSGKPKVWLGFVLTLLLAACSTEENYSGSLDGGAGAIGGGVIHGTSQNVTLSWVAPVEREDGTPISMSEISGYRIYYGETDGFYTYEIDVNESDTMQVTLEGMPVGTYYIVVTTIDMEGRESGYSETIIAIV